MNNSQIKIALSGHQLTQRQAVVALARTFPCLNDKLPIGYEFDAKTLLESARKWSNGELQAALFIIGVWNWRLKIPRFGKFDILDANSYWDSAHRQAFTDWVNDPWWC